MDPAQKYTGIGLMSGTSLDGLDIAYCEFLFEDNVKNFRILEAVTIKYSSQLAERLENGIHISGQELEQLNNDLGTWMGYQCLSFMNKNKVKPDFISSHGHTIFHQPDQKLTLQIGNGNIIHAITKIPVIFDFRALDVALGGQGAPLVPIGDLILFSQFQICVNLGGFANISFDDGQIRKAYDNGAVNIVLNKLARDLGHPYDSGGRIAHSGSLIQELKKKLDNLSYYSLPWPKSLGKEWVEKEVLTILDTYPDSTIQDIMHTYTIHIAHVIAADINHLKKSLMSTTPCKVLLTGGGTYNEFLVENIQNSLLPGIEIVVPDGNLIDYKEALIFTLMGLLRLKGLSNCLKSVTGASENSSSGLIAGPVPHKFLN